MSFYHLQKQVDNNYKTKKQSKKKKKRKAAPGTEPQDVNDFG